jgi:hypothetical protein
MNMKKIIVVLAVLTISSWSSLRAQFEGEIDMKITTNEEGKSRETNMTLLFKNDLLSSETKGGESGMRSRVIIRGDKKVLWIINDERKTVFERSLQESERQDTAAQNTEKPKANLKKTGKTETILSYSCEEWVDQSARDTTFLWCASQLGSVYQDFSRSFGELGGGRMRMRRDVPAWQKDFAGKNLFPLKVISMRDGVVRMTQEVTNITKKTIDPTVFEIPEDYSKREMNFDMNKMLQERMRDRMQQKNEDKKKEDKDNEKSDDDH